ncbi:minor capsid protein [Lapidilactobacillus gannanensis]|uniref:Minor capsid protein n=1 Tax=Lapidilactobacillus gannanensis TaxID=2486002 RepID=A0ABW4BP12_9LACO|nr:minor capsid protein [Lapidilactobacillus gannanensis]
MSNVSLGVKVDSSRLMRKLNPVAFKRGRFALATQASADMNQFVPMKEGYLRKSNIIPRDGSYIEYTMPYSSRMFYGDPGWQYTTPGTGPRWDNVAKARYMGNWKRAFVKGAGLK